jgi:glycosyltransferase involved in cell wall biosynthesis
MRDVTVVIPTHNRKELLDRTLRSVLAQEDVDLSVVVVDDGSADGTEAFVQALADPRVSVVRHPEARGVSAARNTGIARATTTWLAFVDDDDLWAPTKLRAQL